MPLCVYQECNKRSNVAMFRFPVHDNERLNVWIKNSGNERLESLTKKQLHKRYICATHFAASDLHECDSRWRLIGLAVPIPYQPSEDQRFSPTILNFLSPRQIYKDKRNLPSSEVRCTTHASPYSCYITSPDMGKKTQKHLLETVDNQSDDIGSDDGARGDCYNNLAPTQDPDTSNSAQSVTSLHDNEGEHHNVLCNECQGQIIGFRYVCVQCVDWDMCSGCEARAAHSHHYMLRLPGPRPLAKVKSLITAIQEQLQAFFDTALRMEPFIEEIKMEYDIKKEEHKDVNYESIVPQQSKLIEITIVQEEKITQHTITKMKDIPEQAVYYVLPDEQETPLAIKEEPPSLSTTFLAETKPSTSSYSDITTDDHFALQSSVYSTYKPAIKKKKL